MNKKKHEAPIRIEKISIRNYKGIDRLDMDFPSPRLWRDSDILIMGSRNGLGKTSIMECCALLLMAPLIQREKSLHANPHSIINIPDILIRAGAECADISGKILLGKEKGSIRIRIHRAGKIEVDDQEFAQKIFDFRRSNLHEIDDFVEAMCGFDSNPVIGNSFMLFHSHRKIQWSNPQMGMMMRNRTSNRETPREFSISIFKLQILDLLMKGATLFELDKSGETGEEIEVLNGLMKTFAGGIIKQIRPLRDNTLDFRIDPEEGGESYTFDSLGSGQKEIISTLFLIWRHTKNLPSVVFIDEPELHLNAEWHRRLIKELTKLAPNNQYIIATHSEDVMDSVDANQRALLSEPSWEIV